MGRKKAQELPKIILKFEAHSPILADQMNSLWKRVIDVHEGRETPPEGKFWLSKSQLSLSFKTLLKGLALFTGSLNEKIKQPWLTSGLDYLTDAKHKEAFEWHIYKEISNAKLPELAVKVDTCISKLLALHTGDVRYESPKYRFPLKFKRFSPKIAKQIAHLYERSETNDGGEYTLDLPRLVKSLDAFESTLPLLLEQLPEQLRTQLLNNGLDCLHDDNIYNIIEHIGFNASACLKLKTRFDLALTNLRTMHFNRAYRPFSQVNALVNHVDVSRAMTRGYEQFCDIKCWLEEVAVEFRKQNVKSSHTIIDTLNKSLNHITSLLDCALKDTYESDGLSVKDCFSKKHSVVLKYINELENHPSSFMSFLRTTLPEDFGEHRLMHLRNDQDFWKYLKSISNIFESQYRSYLEASNVNSATTTSNIKSFGKYLFKHQTNEVVLNIIDALKQEGIQGLAQNKGEGFLQLNNHLLAIRERTADMQPVKTAFAIYNHVTQCDISLSHFLPYLVVFNNENDGSKPVVDLSFLADRYPQVFEDLIQYINVTKTRTDGKAIQEITLKGQIYALQNVIKKYGKRLNQTDVQLLQDFGLAALGRNSSRLLKYFRQLILEDVKAAKLHAAYGNVLQVNLNIICNFFGIPTSSTHKVSISKLQRLARRRNKNHLYTIQQVVEIAFTVEKCLRSETLTEVQRLCLHAARVLIKTGWNLTPTLELDNDDLFYFDTSLTGNKTAAVRLFKRRAGYRTQFARFAVNADDSNLDSETVLDEVETGKLTAAVMSNLQFIRAMTKGIAEKHSSPILQKRIFAYMEGGSVKILKNSIFVSTINNILKKEGLNLKFSSRRIRTSGLNHIYRKVAKNFAKYQASGMHTPQAFYEFYLKMDNAEVEDNLKEATKVMGDFYIRGETQHVIFTNKASEESKQTPSGRCVQTNDSDVVIDFKRRNRTFFDDDEIDNCADFGACLFCHYFRCIADAEGVWRILSFEAVVLRKMKSSSYSIGVDDSSEQQRTIAKIQNRVIEILSDFAKENEAAIKEGKDLFVQHGIHPDWEVS